MTKPEAEEKMNPIVVSDKTWNWKMKCEGEIWRLKKLWVKKAEIDKFGNEEIWM